MHSKRVNRSSLLMTTNPYEPWRPETYPILQREIIGVIWRGDTGLEIQISDGGMEPSLLVRFPRAMAYQGADEGLRLMDAPQYAGALIYVSRDSPYLMRFRENAAGSMDDFALIHWLVVSCNECLDVISIAEPTIVSARR
jgi:hypothetical protein